MERRKFFYSLFAFVPLTFSFLGITGMSFRFLSPSSKESKLRKVFATNLNKLGINKSMLFNDLRGKELMIIRTGEKEVKALSTVCTHLGCKVSWQEDKNQFYCPCHAGVFDPEGKVSAGPPPKQLDTYPIEIIGNNVFIYLKEKDA